ncbi:hypothetical protein BD769DRAFT_1385285 [Suillus cothurnatus]|nr:hypothetical protein BD769DRAFT_1385285 [Suillus cothurnatus]
MLLMASTWLAFDVYSDEHNTGYFSSQYEAPKIECDNDAKNQSVSEELHILPGYMEHLVTLDIKQPCISSADWNIAGQQSRPKKAKTRSIINYTLDDLVEASCMDDKHLPELIPDIAQECKKALQDNNNLLSPLAHHALIELSQCASIDATCLNEELEVFILVDTSGKQ